MTPGYRSTALTIAALLASYPRFCAAETTTYFGPNNGSWTEPGYWTNFVPSDSLDALINTPTNVQLKSTGHVNNFSVNSPGSLTLLANLIAVGSTQMNSGTIIINNGLSLSFTHNATLSGAGTIIMAGSGSKIYGNFLQFMTRNIISGLGNIGSSQLNIHNAGTITATSGSLTIAPWSAVNGLINAGVLRADGGTLLLPSGTITNTGGTIESLNGSPVRWTDTAIIGGTIRVAGGGSISLNGNVSNALLQTSGNSSIHIYTSTFPYTSPFTSIKAMMSDISNDGLLVIHNRVKIKFAGTLTNTGTVHIAGQDNTALYNDATPLVIRGGGEVFMNGYISALTAVEIDSDNYIHGSGFIGSRNVLQGPSINCLRFTNSGTVTATPSTEPAFTGPLSIGINSSAPSYSDVINKGIFRADGNNFVLAGQCDNSNGSIQAFSGFTVGIYEPVKGGTFLANGSINFFAAAQVDSLTGSGAVSVGTSSSLISNGALISRLSLLDNASHTVRSNELNAGTSKLSWLSLAASNNAFTAVLDINDNKFILQADPSLAGDKSSKASYLQSALLSGFNGGNYLGKGITSGTVAADQSATGSHLTTLSLFDNAALNLTSFGGQSVDTSSLLIATALIGDTNLDQLVNGSDFANWYAHALEHTPYADEGDLNHDGAVDGLDFDLWFNAAGVGAQGVLDSMSLDRAALSALRAPAAVPEAGTGGLLLTVAPWLLKRRGRATKPS